jgi:hypothetical protein
MTPAEYAFERRRKEMEARLLGFIHEMLRPLLEQGREALREYQEAEERLEGEKFSRN